VLHSRISRFFRGWPCLLLALAGPGSIRAQDDAVTTSFGIDVEPSTRYVWRGIVESRGPVLQPSAWVSAQDFTFTVWGNYGLNRESRPWRFNEVDLTLDYGRGWLGLEFEPELGTYLYPNQAGTNTAEASLKVSRPVGPVSFFLTCACDFVSYPGAYYGDGGVSWEPELGSGFTLSVSTQVDWASARFNQASFEVKRWAWNRVGGDLSLSYVPGGRVSIQPHVGFSALLDRRLRSQVAEPDLVFGGVALGLEF
jgi:hypothetical protein